MYVLRTRYTNGVTQDEISCQYHNVDVSHINNPNWPREGFIFTSGKWEDNAPEPPAHYQRLVMYGGEILMFGDGYFVTGFVKEDKFRSGEKALFTMERWHVYARRP